MAGRTLSRRTLRDEYDRVETAEADTPEADDDGGADAPAPAKKKTRARKPIEAKAPKAPAKPRVRKKTTKVPPRMFAKWAVCDGGLKRVAVFDYRDRAGADARLAEFRERKTGTYFLQLVKDPYEPPPVAV